MFCGSDIIQPITGDRQHTKVLRATSKTFPPPNLLEFESILIFLLRNSWLSWAKWSRSWVFSTVPWAPFWWRHMEAGTAAAMLWRLCEPMDWVWMRHTAWLGPHDSPSCLCCDLTSCLVMPCASLGSDAWGCSHRHVYLVCESRCKVPKSFIEAKSLQTNLFHSLVNIEKPQTLNPEKNQICPF